MQLDRGKTCCFSGHRPDKLPGGYAGGVAAAPLRTALVEAIGQAVEDGYDTFLCGMALGADTWAAEEVLRRRDAGAPLRLIGAALPGAGQPLARCLPPPVSGFDRPAGRGIHRLRNLYAVLYESAQPLDGRHGQPLDRRVQWFVRRHQKHRGIRRGAGGGSRNPRAAGLSVVSGHFHALAGKNIGG